ncbi:glycosyltransferase family 2 protein [Geminocystis sp. NIES-3709]|uniref:glycosyltransferase n=1 Tax=Geminocystis sp. NIES-3709 TaxID=1617448 RepID=UPI0005FC3CDD|nr:glycosyltransferase family 2 protein [Geminocystis sp. NIES-3709]BAQ63420.1 glycosyl transferase [Geminocystis sp. NIES-3709]
MPEKDKFNNPDVNTELDPITSLIAEFSDPEIEEEEFRNDFFRGLSGRRKKAAFTLSIIWLVTIALHLVSWSIWFVLILGCFVTVQALRLMFANPTPMIASENTENFPKVSLMVSAKNEEAVVGKLVKMLLSFDYPQDLYEFWVINDNSSDQTGIILDELAQKYPQLKVLHRDGTAKGGKSGALNQAFALTTGDIIGVFDADAIASPNLLKKVVSLFTLNQGAIQVRKSISNADENFWTLGQSTEMALDSYFQQQRIACGGMGELRGNGQFVRRQALESCGGWNEETITDDLDLTIRLHLDHWDIGILEHPAVQEEGVKTSIALWHQRSRWAEGGYQRYFDYWRFILSNRLNWSKKFDLLYFFLVQYIFPTAAIPDLVMVIIRHDIPLIAPLTSLTFLLAFWGMFTGLKRTKSENISITDTFNMLTQSLLGMIYMTHWFLVMPVTTTRMSIRQKQLKWVKTVHEGSSDDLELGLNEI